MKAFINRERESLLKSQVDIVTHYLRWLAQPYSAMIKNLRRETKSIFIYYPKKQVLR